MFYVSTSLRISPTHTLHLSLVRLGLSNVYHANVKHIESEFTNTTASYYECISMAHCSAVKTHICTRLWRRANELIALNLRNVAVTHTTCMENPARAQIITTVVVVHANAHTHTLRHHETDSLTTYNRMPA